MAGINSDTKLMIHCNGVDESTDFTDESYTGHTVTAVGTAQVDTNDKVFGTGSCLLDGDSDYLSIPDHADFDIFADNTENWTIDFRVKCFDRSYYNQIFTTWASEDERFGLYIGTPGSIGMSTKTSGSFEVLLVSADGTIAEDTWYHVAFIKKGTDYGLYVDGTQVAYDSNSNETTFATAILWGARADGLYASCWLDEIRIQYGNYFEASPNSTPDDTISVPSSEYTDTGEGAGSQYMSTNKGYW